MNDNYWAEISQILHEMTDEEFMAALIEAGLNKCPIAFGDDEDDEIVQCINPKYLKEEEFK